MKLWEEVHVSRSEGEPRAWYRLNPAEQEALRAVGHTRDWPAGSTLAPRQHPSRPPVPPRRTRQLRPRLPQHPHPRPRRTPQTPPHPNLPPPHHHPTPPTPPRLRHRKNRIVRVTHPGAAPVASSTM